MKITREERLNTADVRRFCVKFNLFTCGDCYEYEKLFRMCENYTGKTSQLQTIAEHILNNSAQDKFEPYADYGDKICCIMFDLIKECSYSVFLEVKDD